MIERDAPSALRVQFAAAVLGFFGAGGLCAWIDIGTLARALARSAAHVPLIEFRPLYALCLPMAVAFLALAVLALLPNEVAARRRLAGRRRFSANGFTFGLVVLSCLSTTITPLIVGSAVADMMRDRGYQACPAPDAEQRPPMRWVRPGAKCP